MPAYSPFQKPLSDISVEDLAVLREVSEGWYVEYKGELSKSADIAKSVSAFANTYGGWLFYGISEKSRPEQVAGAYPGIERAEVDACLQTLRHSIAAHLNPTPHFDVRVLWGPHGGIGLAEDHAVIAVYVPWNINTPFIHSSGRIYRRVGDGADPKPESDRHILDQLQNRREKLGQEYAKWVERDPDFSKIQAEAPFLRLMIVPDLWQDREFTCDLSLKQYRELISSPDPAIPGIPFDCTYTSPRGFVARQTLENNPSVHLFMWQMNRRLMSDILIPINCYEFNGTAESFYESFAGFSYCERFVEILIKKRYSSIGILDLNLLFNIIHSVIHTQERFFAQFGWKSSFFMKGHFLNLRRTCPFIDIAPILDIFEKYGIPICLERKLQVMPGTGPETFVEIGLNDDDSMPSEARLTTQAAVFFGILANALGVPTWADLEDREHEHLFVELVGAGNRALEAQKRRSRRIGRGGAS